MCYVTYLNTEEWTNDMNRGFLFHWQCCAVLGQFDDATGHPLQFSYILTALANDSTDL